MTSAPLKIAISGGAGGMGLATALRFAAKGAHIALLDLAGDRLTDVAAQVTAAGAKVLPVPVDVRTAATCKAAIASVTDWAGGLDILVNGAGIWLEGPAENVTETEWDRVIDVNLKGAFFLTAEAIPHLAKSRGVIVNIASDAGVVGNTGAAVYCASKGGLVLLTKALALELAPRGIRVNAICPGDVATPMIEDQARIYGGNDPDGYKRKLLENYPQGDLARFINADEIARFIEFICEPLAAPITGAALSIDFGVTAGY